MGLGPTLLLGLIAGVTIFLGLPVGRLPSLAPGTRVLLNAIAVGVLIFLLWDVFSAAWEPIDAALAGLHEGSGGPAGALGYGLLFVGGLAVGLCSLVFYERFMARTARAPRFGPGTMHAAELRGRSTGMAAWSPGRRLALLIAMLLGVAAKAKRTDLPAYGLLIGLVAGFLTDGIVTAAGV